MDGLDDVDQFGRSSPWTEPDMVFWEPERFYGTPGGSWLSTNRSAARKFKNFPQLIPNTYFPGAGEASYKWWAQVRCSTPDCKKVRYLPLSDLFTCRGSGKYCDEHFQEMRRAKIEQRRELLAQQPELECIVSNNQAMMEELGGIRPAHLLVKAKHDSSWIEYVDAEGNTKFMQVHDVRSARDTYGRWAVYGIDQDGEPVHELYDLRHGYEHSGTFSGIRELMFGEIVKLAQQGVIRGKDGKQIETLSGLMQIADEPLRKMIIKKSKEAKAGGPSLAEIEKQLFAGPAASSAQKRAGKTGTRPWPKSMSL